MLGKKEKQRSPLLVWLFKSVSHSFAPPSSLNVSMCHKVTTCGLQMSANMQHLAQTCTRLRVRGYYMEHYDMKSRNHPVKRESCLRVVWISSEAIAPVGGKGRSHAGEKKTGPPPPCALRVARKKRKKAVISTTVSI